MQDDSIGKNSPLSPEEEKARAAILAECNKLAAAKVAFVAVHFDGYGDSGATEDVKCYDSEAYGWEEHPPVKYDASHLQEHFEALVPFGYENDCGGFGDVLNCDLVELFLLQEALERILQEAAGPADARVEFLTVAFKHRSTQPG